MVILGMFFFIHFPIWISSDIWPHYLGYKLQASKLLVTSPTGTCHDVRCQMSRPQDRIILRRLW